MTRPLVTMGEVWRWTPPQVPPLKSRAPVSPSKACRLAPFMNHTIGLAVPSVVVETGDRRRISSSGLVVAHQSMIGLMGLAVVSRRRPMIWLSLLPPGQTDPMVVVIAMRRPLGDL